MKYCCLFLLIFSYLLSSGQDYKITYGDKEYMKLTQIIIGTNNPLEEWVLKDSVPDGRWMIYRDKAKSLLKSEGNTEGGKMEGVWTDYDKKGRKSRDIGYYKGVLHGQEIYYNVKTGEPLLIYNYSIGMKQGAYQIFHANGTKWEEGYFTRGLPDKDWKYWDKEGKLIRERTFSEGRIIDQKSYE